MCSSWAAPRSPVKIRGSAGRAPRTMFLLLSRIPASSAPSQGPNAPCLLGAECWSCRRSKGRHGRFSVPFGVPSCSREWAASGSAGALPEGPGLPRSRLPSPPGSHTHLRTALCRPGASPSGGCPGMRGAAGATAGQARDAYVQVSWGSGPRRAGYRGVPRTEASWGRPWKGGQLCPSPCPRDAGGRADTGQAGLEVGWDSRWVPARVPGALPAEHRGRGLQSGCCSVSCARAGVRVACPEAEVLAVRPAVSDVAGRALPAFSVPRGGSRLHLGPTPVPRSPR